MEQNLILQRNKMHSNPPKCRVMEKSCQMVGKFARKSQDYCVVPWRYRALFFVPLSKKGGLVIFKQQDTHRAFFLSSQKTFKDRNHLKNAKNISHIFIPLHSFLICCFDSCVFKLETVSEGVSHRSISSDISYSYARLYREIHTLKRFAFFD